MLEADDIQIKHMPINDQSVDLVFSLWTDPIYTSGYPGTDRGFHNVYKMVRSWECGQLDFWLGTYLDAPVSVFHGEMLNKHMFEIHQLTLKEFWGRRNWPIQIEVSKAVVKEIFRGIPSLNQIIGFTPVKLPLAIKFAERGGFQKVGVMPNYFEYNDGRVDAAIMVKLREDS